MNVNLKIQTTDPPPLELNLQTGQTLGLTASTATKVINGATDYELLTNKPSIEMVELSGNRSFPDLGIFIDAEESLPRSDDYALGTLEIDNLWNLAML